nr:TnpV protein [uncultured Clostridium sp.]
MAKFEFEYAEIDGLLYPYIEIDGKNKLDHLGKHGRLRLIYLHEQKHEMYRKLLLTGRLVEHCMTIEKSTFEMAVRIRADYLKAHPMPEDDVMECIRLSGLEQEIADECILYDLISR